MIDHLSTLPVNGERKFDGGDRYIQDAFPSAEPPPAGSVEVFEKWAPTVLNRERPAVWQWATPGSRLASVKIGAGSVVLAGAPPGAGKTALAGQISLDAMREPGQEDLRILNANVEMPPAALLDRHLARVSGVGYGYIQDRTYDESARPRIAAAIEELRCVMPRIEFLRPPFTLENLSERAVNFGADLVIVDYAQRFDHEKRSSDQRSQTNRVMDACRRLADDGRGVLVIAALNRSGYGPDATISAFRESSEMEYGCDSAWLLIRDGDSSAVTLRCVKNRHGRLEDVQVLFDGSRQQFDDDPAEFSWMPE